MARKEFVDLQINGYMGVDFSDPALTKDSFLKCADSIFESGTCLFLPTVITSSEELYKRNIGIIYEAVMSHGLQSRIPGLHLEGPFISPEPGAVGAHNPAWVAAPKKDYLDRLISFAPEFIKILTVAPEREGALDLISYASSKGIKVSMGHNLAAMKDITDGAKAGACLITHMGNGIMNMGGLIIVTMLAGGLLEIVRVNGGIDYLIRITTARIKSKRGAEVAITSLTALANVCTANNTIAILTVGDISRDIAKQFNISPRRSASLMDTSSCFVQGIIPYGAQLLMASGLATISPVAIIPYLYYPMCVGAVIALSILIKRTKKTA